MLLVAAVAVDVEILQVVVYGLIDVIPDGLQVWAIQQWFIIGGVDHLIAFTSTWRHGCVSTAE